MNQTEQLIEVGRAYIDALNKLDMDHPERVAHILNILDCIHPDPGYHWGIYIEGPWLEGAVTHRCKQSWFHCYQGIEEPIIEQPYKSNDGGIYNYGTMRYLRLTFDFFNHLSIDPTPMGAWQAYLLSIAKTLLPFSGRLYYTKRKLIFSHDQLKDIDFDEWEYYKNIDLVNLNEDVSPSVYIEGKQAVVSCCYWNDWRGLVREYATLTFFNERVYLFDDFEEEKLFDYDIGIRF